MNAFTPQTHAIETVYARLMRLEVYQAVICSPEAQAGSSTLARAVAVRAAASGKRVLLIELNMRTPSQHFAFDCARNEWLPLTGHWEHAVQSTEIPGLSLLTSPEKSGHCVEFRDVETLRLFFGSTRSGFDLVLCDAGPLLFSGDPIIQTELVCAASAHTLLNVLTTVTTESQVDEIRILLEQSGVQLCGVVMNDRFAPCLKRELIRETWRLQKICPGWMGWLRSKLERSLLLNQDL